MNLGMIRWRRLVLALGACAALAAPARADAQVVRLNAAFAGWFPANRPLVFTVDAQIGHRFFPSFEAGGRVGIGLLLGGAVAVGIPIDLYARFSAGQRLRIYFELAGGPWVLAGTPGPTVLGHVEFGVGITGGRVSFGPFIGWLSDSSYLAGIRLGASF